jgi:hypothetical protein
MTERDAFEVRFHAAVRGYVGHVSSDLDPAELAHLIAGARPRRSRPGASLPMPAIAIPRLAWVLLLLAGLLAATVGGMLVAGSRPNPKLPAVVVPLIPAVACPAGSNPDRPGPVGQARPPQTFTAAMTFDRRAGRIVMLVDPDNTERTQTWTFDVCTNTWTRMADGPMSGGQDALVYDADDDLTITVDAGTNRVWAYDLTSDTWTAKAQAPAAVFPSQGRARMAYDPISGNVLRAVQGTPSKVPDLWTYDVGTDTWTATSTGGFSSNVLVAYDASADRLVAYDYPTGGQGWTTTRLLDLRHGTWTDSTATTPMLIVGWFATGNEITYDETARRTVIFGRGQMFAYDAAADRWDTVFEEASAGDGRCAGSRCRWYATTVYDPVNERLVVYGGEYEDPSRLLPSQTPGPSPAYGAPAHSPEESASVRDDSVLAFDLATRTWSVLLEATGMQPAAD